MVEIHRDNRVSIGVNNYFDAINSFTVSDDELLFIYVDKGEKIVHFGDRDVRYTQGELLYCVTVDSLKCENNCDKHGDYQELYLRVSKLELVNIITCFCQRYGFNIEFNNNLLWRKERVISECVSLDFQVFFSGVINSKIKGVNKSLSSKIGYSGELMEFTYMLLASNIDSNVLAKVIYDIKYVDSNFYSIISNYIFKKISIVDLAKKCDMTLTQLNNQFLNYFGLSPHRWMVRKRLEYSKTLLETTSKSLDTIAEECLFSTTSHFILNYRGHFGSTPSKYRKLYRRELLDSKKRRE